MNLRLVSKTEKKEWLECLSKHMSYQMIASLEKGQSKDTCWDIFWMHWWQTWGHTSPLHMYRAYTLLVLFRKDMRLLKQKRTVWKLHSARLIPNYGFFGVGAHRGYYFSCFCSAWMAKLRGTSPRHMYSPVSVNGFGGVFDPTRCFIETGSWSGMIMQRN